MRAFETAFLFVLAVVLATVTALWLLLVMGVSGGTAAGAALLIVLLALTTLGVLVALSVRAAVVTASDSEGERYRVRRKGIAQAVELAAVEVPGVEDLTPIIHGGGGGLQIECLARVHPPFNPIDVKQRLTDHLAAEIPWLTGLSVKEVVVRFRRPELPESEGLW